MVKRFYVVRHNTGSYLKSSVQFQITKDAQQAFRASTPEEAAGCLDKLTPIPLAWRVVWVDYDTLTGRVIDVESS